MGFKILFHRAEEGGFRVEIPVNPFGSGHVGS